MKKIIILGVVILFVGVGFSSGIGVNIEQTSFPLNVGETAWWKASECDGTTLYDCSGHNYNGTIYGADWTPGCCLDFDGIDDYVDLDNHSVSLGMNKTDYYIIMVRFKSTGYGMFYSMSHTNPERAYFDLMLDEEGRITVEMGDETCLFDLSTSGSFNDGEWHLVECYFEGDSTNPTLDIYVDGDLKATKTDWLPPMLNEDFLTAKVGRDSNAETDYFNGEIDDIKIYNQQPPPPPPYLTITGPDSGKPGQELTFIFRIDDSEENDWIIDISWSDGTYDTVFGSSNSDIPVSHIWDAKGNYLITAYAQGENGLIIGASKRVTIPRDKSTSNMLLLRILERFPLLQKLIQQQLFGL
jgi:hypothetical protein